jgi:hypothetical protein
MAEVHAMHLVGEGGLHRVYCAQSSGGSTVTSERVGSQVATTGFLERKRHIRQAKEKMAAIGERDRERERSFTQRAFARSPRLPAAHTVQTR